MAFKWHKPKTVWHKHQNPDDMMETRMEIGKHFYVYAEVYRPTSEFGDDYVCRVSFNTYIEEFGTTTKTLEQGMKWAEKIINRELEHLHKALGKHLAR